MFRHPLIIVLVLIVKENNAHHEHFWCPKNLLESLVNCLFHCHQLIIVDDEIEGVRCRVACTKENYCIRKPWDLLNRKMALAREYTKCMIGCIHYFQYRLDILKCDAECIKRFDKKLSELIINPLDGSISMFDI